MVERKWARSITKCKGTFASSRLIANNQTCEVVRCPSPILGKRLCDLTGGFIRNAVINIIFDSFGSLVDLPTEWQIRKLNETQVAHHEKVDSLASDVWALC